jgi:Flp pilus assembly pilin Flp
MLKRIVSRCSDAEGQVLVEYTLIVLFASVVTVAALTALGQNARDLLTPVAGAL